MVIGRHEPGGLGGEAGQGRPGDGNIITRTVTTSSHLNECWLMWAVTSTSALLSPAPALLAALNLAGSKPSIFT